MVSTWDLLAGPLALIEVSWVLLYSYRDMYVLLPNAQPMCTQRSPSGSTVGMLLLNVPVE